MDGIALSRRIAPTTAMPDWLDKARRTITRRPGRSEPERFERDCVCGETVHGERLPQARQVSCEGCGREWFILPRDPYPRPRPSEKGKSPWRPTAEASSAGFPTVRKSRGIPSAAGLAPRPPRPGRSPVRQRLKETLAAAKHSARARAVRAAKPLRLVGAGIAVTVVLTGAWLWHRSRIDAASATLVAAVPRGEQAIADRDFPTALRRYTEAVRAIDVLGTRDATAIGVRQRHRELLARSSLAAETPYDLAAQAEQRSKDPQSWTEHFRAVYAGRWVVLDVPFDESEPAAPTVEVVATDDPAAPRERPAGKIVPLDLPLTAGEFPIRFEIDAVVFQRLRVKDRAIFAAQYDSWRLHREAAGPATWVVRFRPETAFAWCSPDLYASLGFDPDASEDPPRPVLERQAKIAGVPTDRIRTADETISKGRR